MVIKGQKISDRYQIIKSIGEGGMANVYLAYDTILDRNVAVKVLRGDLSTDEKFVRRFQREALSASSLIHENIVQVYDVGEDNGDYYIVMEYIEGKHLKTLLKKRGKLTITEVIDIMLQVTSGLSLAHDQYIIHRDIKPQNIMILENGLVKLADFGIAVAMNSTQLTQTNSVMGSVHYLPPEQAAGKGATFCSDIYSLGILMYELLTGKLPFRGDNAVEIALKQLKERMPSIREDIPDIPNSIENIIYKATAKNPKNRYADAREMHDDLLTCLDDARKKEEKYVYEYPDEVDDLKNTKTKKEIIKPKKITKKEGEEIVAKKITEGEVRKQNKILLNLGIVFTGLIVVITTIVVLLPVINKSENIKVVNVIGLTESEAIEKLQDAGFVIKDSILEASDTIESGVVIRTDPQPGRDVKKGRDITLTVSKGKEIIEIANYVGEKADYIKGVLESKGLEVRVDKKEIEDDDKTVYEEDVIIGQSIEVGTKLTTGDQIILYIPQLKNKYPDFTDGSYTVSDVIIFCEEYGVTPIFKDVNNNTLSITKDNSEEYNDLVITRQSRLADSKVTASAKITIWLDVTAPEEEENNLD